MTERYYYTSVHVVGIANTEVVEEILTSTEEEPKFVDAIAFVEDTPSSLYDAVLVAYIEREKIMEFPLEISLLYNDVSNRLGTDLWYLLGHNLPVGQSLRVGHISGSLASNVYYVVRYKILE